MVHAVVAVIAMIFMLMISGALMLFSDYMKAALYIKVFFLNLIWFIVATGFKEYDVYYPDVFGNKWLNFLLMATAFMLLTFEISRFVKLRNAVLLTVGTVTHMFIALMIVNFCGGMPGWAVSVYLTISSCIIFGIHLAAIYGGKNTEAGGFVSRALAGILMMPAPFLITSGCMLTLSSNNDKIINTMPLKDFIQQVYVMEYFGRKSRGVKRELVHLGDLLEIAADIRCGIVPVERDSDLESLDIRNGLAVFLDVRESEDVSVALLEQSALYGIVVISVCELEAEIAALLVPGDLDHGLICSFAGSAIPDLSILELSLVSFGTVFVDLV